MQKREVKLFAPKSLNILLIQCLSISPLIVIIDVFFIIATSTPKTPSTFGDFLILLIAFIFPLVFMSFFMLYFPLRYRTLIVFEVDSNILRKIKKKSVQNFKVSGAKSLVMKTTGTNLYCKYCLMFEDAEKNLQIIFDENTPFGKGHWEIFAEKLSTITGLSLKKLDVPSKEL